MCLFFIFLLFVFLQTTSFLYNLFFFFRLLFSSSLSSLLLLLLLLLCELLFDDDVVVVVVVVFFWRMKVLFSFSCDWSRHSRMNAQQMQPVHASRGAMEPFLDQANGPIWGAPMVRGSELAFRMNCRKHNFKVMYTPMLKSEHVVKGSADELKLLETCEGDTPLVAQLCGRDPKTLYDAAKVVIAAFGKNLNAIDLNLGCPQVCAEKGKYGAFLLEEPEQTSKCIASLCKATKENSDRDLPVFCKIRIGNTVGQTVRYAEVIKSAGAKLIAVHCRTRMSKHDGPADYEHAKALVQKLDIPVVVNGNINTVKGARRILQETGCLAAMSATALLRNPRLLKGADEMEGVGGDGFASSLALEYLSFCEKYPPPSPLYIRKHFRWIFRNILEPKEPLLTSEDWQKMVNDPENGWKLKMWTFLNRPCLVSTAQFTDICRLYEFKVGMSKNKKRQALDEVPTFRSIRKKRSKIE